MLLKLFQLRLSLLIVLLASLSVHAQETLEYEGALYHFYRLPLAKQSGLELRWLNDQGQPLVNYPNLRAQLSKEGKKIAFMMNAGIYKGGPAPCGLMISDFKTVAPLNLEPGEGNFYMKPNGVFYVDDATGPGIVEAGAFRSLTVRPRIANQSGPLMLHKGVIHPAFKAGSPNKRLRNAVGVVAATKEVIFAISDREDRVKGRVTFHQFSRLFLHLGCQDALYLDGDISHLIVSPAPDLQLPPHTFAGMFVVTE